MGRAKLPIKFITREKNRNITFKKRRNGLKKKIYEFATLCDVNACMICFGPEGPQSSEVTTWPEERHKVEAILCEYRSRGSEEQRKRTWDVVSYLTEQKKKAEEEVLRWQKENANLLYPSWDKELDDWPEEFLRQLENNLNYKLEAVQKQIEELKEKQTVEIQHDNDDDDADDDQMVENIMLSQAAPHHTQYYCGNYLLDMNRTLEMIDPPPPQQQASQQQLHPMPISSLKPLPQLLDPHNSEPRYVPSLFCDSSNNNILYPSMNMASVPNNIHNYDFANYNGMINGNNLATPHQMAFLSSPSPGYAMYETKEYFFYKKDYHDLGIHHLHAAGSTNHRTFSMLEGGASSSSSSSHNQMVTQPGYLPHLPMTGFHPSMSEFQSPGSHQLTDLFWQFSTGGNNI